MQVTTVFKLAAALTLSLAAAACDDEGGPCAGVDCGRGSCFTDGVEPFCSCFVGDVPVGLECVASSQGCDGVSCDGHGGCVEDGDGHPIGCRCDDGFHRSVDGFHCLPGEGADGDADADADAEMDADEPECSESAPCSSPERPFCDEGRCMGCLDDEHCLDFSDRRVCRSGDGVCVSCDEENVAHCPDTAPFCADNQCVACLEDQPDHCDTPTAPRCLDGRCQACEVHDDCSRFEGAPWCDHDLRSCVSCIDDSDVAESFCSAPERARCVDGECQPCEERGDCSQFDETETCGARSCVCHNDACVECAATADCPLRDLGLDCNLTTNTCVDACFRCGEDDDCMEELGPGFACVLELSGSLRCLQLVSGDDPGPGPPWKARELRAATSETRLVNVWAPPFEGTSCAAVEMLGDECETRANCGISGVDSDAQCNGEYCTYPCDDDANCYDGATCLGFQCEL